MSFSLRAAAKLNLTLKITGRDARGYHLLDSLMLSVPVFDTLTFELRDEEGFTVTSPDFPDLPQANTLTKAATQLQAEGYSLPGCQVTLRKEIPVMAGMGGGSADGAAVLKGLCRLADIHPEREVLEKLALRIGADVPFMLDGGFARAKGVGEVLTPLEMPTGLNILCVKGRTGLSTPVIFRLYDEVGSDAVIENEAFLKALVRHDYAALKETGGNALQKAALQLCPEVGELIAHLYAQGAGYAAMTGSGTAVFGLFEEAETAQKAQMELPEGKFWSQFCRL